MAKSFALTTLKFYVSNVTFMLLIAEKCVQ